MLNLVKRLKSRKGFTLIELIVVIAILGILAAILVPSILGYVGQANEAADQANARSVYLAANAAYTSMTQEERDKLTEGSYNSDDDDSGFIKAINNFLGSSFEGDYIVTVSKNGVVSATYGEETYPKAETSTTSGG